MSQESKACLIAGCSTSEELDASGRKLFDQVRMHEAHETNDVAERLEMTQRRTSSLPSPGAGR